MASVDFRKGIIWVGAIIILLSIITLVVVLAVRKKPMPSTSRCPTLDPPEFITISTGAEFGFKAIVSWSVVEGATTYAVYRKSEPGINKSYFDEKLFTTGNQVTFNNLIDPVQYFSVAAFNECGEGTLSPEKKANVVCVLDPPNNIQAHSINSTNAQVSWDAVQNATKYNVYVNDVKVFTGNTTTTTITTNLPGNYTIQVSTENQCGEGQLSSPYILNVPVIFI